MRRGLTGNLDAVTPSTSHLLSAGSAMRFETSQSTSTDFNRRLQLRMISFVAMIVVLVFFVNVIFTEVPKPLDTSSANRTRIRTQPRDPDLNARLDERRPLGPEEFMTAPAERFELPVERSREWLDEQIEQGEEWAGDVAARGREEARHNTRFNKRLLWSVRDNTIGIRHDEADAYYRLLNHVQRVSPEELELASTTETQYVNLMVEPDRFRGEPLTIQGDLWRLYELEAGPNDVGLSTLYEAWIFTGDSRPHPYRVVCTHLPHTLTPNDNVRKAVRVTGYFFKREAYPTRGGFHIAPTLLATTITPFRAANSVPPTDSVIPYMVGVVSATGLALLVTLLAFTLGDRRVRRLARQQVLNAPSPSFAGIELKRVVSVEECLRQFTEQERQADLRDEIAGTGRNAGAVATSVLYRRDPYATVPPRVPVSLLSEDELHSRQLSQAVELQKWTSHQQDLGTDAATRSSAAAVEREQRDTERVLERLDSERVTAGEEPAQSHDDSGDSSTLSVRKARTDGSVFTLNQARTSNAGQSQQFAQTRDIARSESTSDVKDSIQTDRSWDETTRTGTASAESEILLGASKLAEWESEIEQFSTRSSSKHSANSGESSRTSSTTESDERIARVDLNRDRLLREQELRERLQRQQSELEAERQQQVQRDHAARVQTEWNASRADADRERIRLDHERTRLENARLEHVRTERERLQRDEQNRERHERLEQERLERERLLRERLLREAQAREPRELERGERFETERNERHSVQRGVPTQEDATSNKARSEEAPLEESSIDESSLTEEQREARRQRGTRRGGWGWPRRGQTSQQGDDVGSTSERILRPASEARESLNDEPVEDDLSDDDGDDDDESAAEATETNEAPADGSPAPKKKFGWAAYNEKKPRGKRRRRE